MWKQQQHWQAHKEQHVEAQYLRIILVVIGGLIVLGLIWDGLRRKRKLRWDHSAMEPVITEFSEENLENDPNLGPVRTTIVGDPLEPVASKVARREPLLSKPVTASYKARVLEAPKVETTTSAKKAEIQAEFADDLLVVNITAPKNKPFAGYELLQTILANGFRFGQMQLFHRHKESNGQGPVLFSLASATETGTFDMNNIGGFSCQGLTLYMKLPGPKDTMAALELMLNTARNLAENLNGEVRDHKLKILSDASIEAYKSQVRQLEQGQMALDLG
jgi:cell division protein ZipA